MIKYKLICKNCELCFDSWFSSSGEFEKLKKRGLLSCHKCDSKKVEKSLMAPKLINTPKADLPEIENKNFKKINKKLKEYQKFIKNNFEYVGENFAYEARSIHYGKKKILKKIYGKTTIEEAKELKEEGIETDSIPWFNDRDN